MESYHYGSFLGAVNLNSLLQLGYSHRMECLGGYVEAEGTTKS